MSDDVVEDCLSSLIDLTVSSKGIPPGVQHSLLSVDPLYRTCAQYSADSTFALLRYLVGYVTGSDPSSDPDDIVNDVDTAIDDLLVGINVKADERIVANPIKAQTRIVDGIEVIYAVGIRKHARFVGAMRERPVVIKSTQIPKIKVPVAQSLVKRSIKFVDDVQSVAEAVAVFKKQRFVTVSVETHRIHTYRPFPCLISIYGDGKVLVVDILKIGAQCPDLEALFVNPNVTKVIYAANSVIQVLWETLGFAVNNVYDPQAAFQYLGMDDQMEVILGEKGVSLSKVLVDWRIRPLTDRMIRIAANRAWLLPKVATVPQNEMDEDMLFAVMDLSINYTPQPYVFSKDAAEALTVKLMGENSLQSSLEHDVMYELIVWRDGIAIIEDEAPNSIIPDRSLVALVRVMPRECYQFDEVKMPKTPIMVSYKHDICQNIERSIVRRRTSK